MSLLIQLLYSPAKDMAEKGWRLLRSCLGLGGQKGGDQQIVIPNSCLVFPIYFPALS